MSCPVCRKQYWEYIFETKDRMFSVSGLFKIYRCRLCKTTGILPQPKQEILVKHYSAESYYSYSANNYKSIFGRLRSYAISLLYDNSWFSWLVSILIQVPAMPDRVRNGKILDIGCGSGETLAQLQSIGWLGYGLDIDKKAIINARKLGVLNASLGSHKDIVKYKNSMFDAIRLYHVIEHISDPREALALIKKKLKPGGQLIIGTPNSASLLARLSRSFWYNLDCPRHLFIFSPESLNKLLWEFGFLNLRIKYISAGGIVGTIQYLLEQVFFRKIDLINRVWIVLLFYPLERIIDFLKVGDIFVTYARKQ